MSKLVYPYLNCKASSLASLLPTSAIDPLLFTNHHRHQQQQNATLPLLNDTDQLEKGNQQPSSRLYKEIDVLVACESDIRW
jgi:hypothetical protein